jgi:hypothetical protein
MQAPAVLTEVVKTYHEERMRLTNKGARERARLSRRIAEIERETRRLVDGIAKGRGDPAVLGARMKEIVAERAQRETQLTLMPVADKTVVLHPGVLARYEKRLQNLQAELAAGAQSGDLDGVAALRDLIESVTVDRDAARAGGVCVVITGRLNAILGEKAYPNGVCCPS